VAAVHDKNLGGGGGAPHSPKGSSKCGVTRKKSNKIYMVSMEYFGRLCTY